VNGARAIFGKTSLYFSNAIRLYYPFFIRCADSRQFRAPSPPPPVCTKPLNASLDPFLHDRSLKLCKNTHHAEERLAGGGGGINALLINEQVHLLRLELGEEIGQMR